MTREYITESWMDKAYQNWVDFHYGWDCEEAIIRFFAWVDPDRTDRDAIDPWCSRKVLKVLPDTASRINLLAGLHFHAHLKRYYINHPWK